MKNSVKDLEIAFEKILVAVRKSAIQKQRSEIEHRMEFVDMYRGVEYINDAKAMDVNSTWYSIDHLQKPIIWIASSSVYENDYSLYHELDTSKIKAIISLGSAKEQLVDFFASKVELRNVVNELHEAVNQAMVIANPGDVVLFSPSCADFDTFKHYKEAGQLFRKAVRETRL